MAPRKRKRPCRTTENETKRTQIEQTSPCRKTVQGNVLEQFYARVLTLREYLSSKLPADSKVRRRKLETAGQEGRRSSTSSPFDSHLLKALLDTTLVGVPSSRRESSKDDRATRWSTHVGNAETSEISFNGLNGEGGYSQSEVRA